MRWRAVQPWTAFLHVPGCWSPHNASASRAALNYVAGAHRQCGEHDSIPRAELTGLTFNAVTAAGLGAFMARNRRRAAQPQA